MRVSLLALLIAACGNNGTAAPITSGVLASATAPVVPPSTPPPVVGTAQATAAVTSTEPTLPATCSLDGGPSTFSDIGIGPTLQLRSRVLYSWTTVEQARALMTGGPLLSRTERPGKGPGHALEYLRDQYAPVSENDRVLQELLLSEQFARARYAWPYSWATRMGWPATAEGPAESYGNQLLRIVVKPAAIWVVVEPGGLKVVDNEGVPVALADVSRLAGMYFVRGEGAGGVDCGGSFGPRLFTSFREFIVTNPDMIESWELGTDTVRAAVQAEIGQLTQFFQIIRSCPDVSSVEEWAGQIACSGWDMPQSTTGVYSLHLALLNANYLPRAAEIAAIVGTLEQDLDEWTIVATNDQADSSGNDVDAGANAEADAGVTDALTWRGASLSSESFGNSASSFDARSAEPGASKGDATDPGAPP